MKKSNRKFRPFGTAVNLECLGCSKVNIRAEAGAVIRIMVYVICGVEENLLGREDAERLGLIKIDRKGAREEQVRKITQFLKERDLPAGSIVSGGETQDRIDETMAGIKKKCSKLFSG